MCNCINSEKVQLEKMLEFNYYILYKKKDFTPLTSNILFVKCEFDEIRAIFRRFLYEI